MKKFKEKEYINIGIIAVVIFGAMNYFGVSMTIGLPYCIPDNELSDNGDLCCSKQITASTDICGNPLQSKCKPSETMEGPQRAPMAPGWECVICAPTSPVYLQNCPVITTTTTIIPGATTTTIIQNAPTTSTIPKTSTTTIIPYQQPQTPTVPAYISSAVTSLAISFVSYIFWRGK